MGNLASDFGYTDGNTGMAFLFGGGRPGGPTQSPTGQRLQGLEDVASGSIFHADKRLGGDVAAPQIGSSAPVVIGTDPNGQSIYGPSGATVEAPKWQQAQVAQAQAAQAAMAPQAQGASMLGAQLDAAQANQTRQAQNQLATSLQGTAAGQGPSIAQAQLQQATAGNINQQAAQAQALHGSARLAALRQAQMTGAATQQTAAAQAAGLRAQEIQAAQANLGNVLGTQRGQDIGLSAQNAQLAQQTGMVNSGYQQQANMLNPQLAQQTNMLNANLQQGANQFNAGSQNTSNLAFAGQQNQGNLSIANANLGAQQGTNQLNTNRAQIEAGINQRAIDQMIGVNSTLYNSEQDYEKEMRESDGLIGKLGSSIGIGGMTGGIGGGLF